MYCWGEFHWNPVRENAHVKIVRKSCERFFSLRHLQEKRFQKTPSWKSSLKLRFFFFRFSQIFFRECSLTSPLAFVRCAATLVKSRCCVWVCALSLTMFTRREAMFFEHCKYRRMRTLPRQCILVQVREKRARRPPARETDRSSSPFSFPSSSSLHPLIFLTLLFALAARNNSIDQYVSPSVATRENNAILDTVLFIRYCYITFLMYLPKKKELIWAAVKMH